MRKSLLRLILIGVIGMLVGTSYMQSVYSSEIEPTRDTYRFTFSEEGQYQHVFGVIIGTATDRDTYIINITKTLTITVVVADCCLMGDTIAIFYPTNKTVFRSATSPAIIIGTTVLAKGVYTFWIGYTYCSTGNAGYDIWIVATHA